jgi:hypothetical protein
LTISAAGEKSPAADAQIRWATAKLIEHIPGQSAVLVLLGLVVTMGPLTTLTAQGLEWRFSAQSAGIVALPPWLPRDSLRASLSYYEDSPATVAGFLADLNDDGTQDYVFRVSLDVCGSNCEYVLVDGASHRTLGRVGGSVVVVRPPMINGYPVIHAYGHSSADAGRWSTSVFDGQRYVFVGSVYLEGVSLRRHFEALREIPFWPPPNRR